MLLLTLYNFDDRVSRVAFPSRIIRMKKHGSKNKKRRGALLKTAAGSLLLAIAILLIGASFVFDFEEWREFDEKLITDCPKALMLYDREGRLLSVRGPEKRIWVSISELSPHTVNAFVSAEDARFYSHGGIDLYRVFGAAWADIKAGSFVQGASTISQQLIKLSHLSTEKTLDRKLEEAVLAMQLEGRFSKDEIMELYLNYIYFGGGFYGIEAAALGYFGVHAAELTTAQSAQLAGIPKSPSAYAPHLDPEASKGRRDSILGLMHEYGYIDDSELDSALAEEPVLSPALPQEKGFLLDMAIDEAALVTGLSREELLKSGYSIVTTQDSRITAECAELMRDDSLFPADNAQGALVVLGENGNVEAIEGARGGYSDGVFDRASGSKRQPGSLIKPVLVYAPAMELFGYSPTSLLLDEPTAFGDYEPRNSDEKYYGFVTLRTALMRSLNVPAVKVLADVGIPQAALFAQRMGVDMTDESPGLPLALGGFTHGVTPLAMAGAYSVFSNGGVYIEPHTVLRILDDKGEPVYSRPICGERVMSEANSFLLTSMLKSAVSEGTARRLGETGLPLAAKTGTVIDAGGVRDAWCAAYTRSHTAVVWMGTDSAHEGSLSESAVGGNQPARMLAELFSYIYESTPCGDFLKPEGVTEALIDVSAEAEGAIYAADENTPAEYVRSEYFIEGREPAEHNPKRTVPEAPSELGWSMGGDGMPVIAFTADGSACYTVVRTDAMGREKTVFETEGVSGYVSFADPTAAPGCAYSYVITAKTKTPEGDVLESAPSRRMRVVVPFVQP